MSFFGKKATREEADTRKNLVVSTGGRIDGMATWLSLDGWMDGLQSMAIDVTH
jgi:hypothetical protein